MPLEFNVVWRSGYGGCRTCTRPDLFEVAATYDLEEFASAVEHAAWPGRRGTVLRTGPERV